MYRIQFFVGLPHASPRQEVATAITMHDDPDKAFAEAKSKAEFIAKLLHQQFTGRTDWQPPVEDDEDYVDGHLTEAAKQRLRDERLLELMGPHPLPSRDVRAHLPPPSIELQLTSDDGQITLIDVPMAPMGRKPEQNGSRPSGDYRAQIGMKYGDQEVGLGELQYANTTAVRALINATESARLLVTKLQKEPGLRFMNFKDIRIHVERINTQISLVEEGPDFDWRHMEYPAQSF